MKQAPSLFAAPPAPGGRRPRRAARQPQLDTLLADLDRVSPARAEALRRLGLRTVRDLLFHRPRRHDDQRQRSSVSELQAGQSATLEVEIRHLRARRAWRRQLAVTEARVGDESGELEVIWFNQPYLGHVLQVGERVTLHGRVGRRSGRLQLSNPQVESERRGLAQAGVGVLVPTYPATYALSSRWLAAQIRKLLPLADRLVDPLPEAVRRQESLVPISVAVRQIHYPQDPVSLEQAKERLAFDELLYPQLAALLARRDRLARAGVRSPYRRDVAREFVSSLPFQLTEDQRRAAHQILIDMDRPAPMKRLLQGDVGSGKTVVAALAARMAIAAQHQVVLMVPTEVLARQHFQTFSQLMAPFQIAPRLLVGSTTAAVRREVLAGLAVGADRLLVGTHALIEDQVQFPDLALCIVDEQHRFGVEQRLRLLQKAPVTPDVLSMTATPIPRSLARTVLGDLDVSRLRQQPKGRLAVETRLVPPAERASAYEFLRQQVRAGRQAFVICPLVEDSPTVEARSATALFERLREEVLPDLRLTLLHGKLPAKQKVERMDAFRSGEAQVLVATSVIEVGVDVANASVMAVEGAERFGLAQLHQFRGRVGRGPHASYCLLLPEVEDEAQARRLQALVEHSDGFEIAELDLKLRQAGDPYGVRQHGAPDLRVGDLLDEGLRQRARAAAEALLRLDPEVSDPLLRSELLAHSQVYEFD